MKITFISNYLTPHQIPFSEKMVEREDIEYYFVSTCPMERKRIELGWENEKKYSYELKAYINDEEKSKVQTLMLESDVVIIGSAPDTYIIPRLKKGKLTFKYAERFYKKGLTMKNFGHAMVGAWLHHGRFQQYPLYMLCASAYTATDCVLFGNYKGKMYKWGYFPEQKIYDIDLLIDEKAPSTILWAGRLIEFKHPEMAVLLAEELQKQNYKFEMKIIGTGELEEQIQTMILEKGLSEYVQILGAMNPDRVRQYMEKAEIYLMTSDFEEGWGAVVNEAMNSGCVVVASHAAGSVPFLIENEQNGLIFENGNQKQLNELVIKLLNNKELEKCIGKNAYLTISNLWNAKTAVDRFIKLSQNLLVNNSNEECFINGPCSRAKRIKNNWYKKKVDLARIES